MISLVLAFEDGGKKLSLATIHDEALLLRAAHLALAQSEQEVREARKTNPMLGRLRAADDLRLRTALLLLIPGLDMEPKPGHVLAM